MENNCRPLEHFKLSLRWTVSSNHAQSEPTPPPPLLHRVKGKGSIRKRQKEQKKKNTAMSERVQSLHSSSLIFKVQRDPRVLAQLGIIADSHFIVLFVDLLLCMMYYFLFYIKQDLKKKQHNTSPHFFFFVLFSYQNLGRRNCFCTIAFREKRERRKFHCRCSTISAGVGEENLPPIASALLLKRRKLLHLLTA